MDRVSKTLERNEELQPAIVLLKKPRDPEHTSEVANTLSGR
jgi:hypothetical protein